MVVLWFCFLGLCVFIGFLIWEGAYDTIFWLFVFPGVCLGILYGLHFWNELAFQIGFVVFLVTVPYIAYTMAFR